MFGVRGNTDPPPGDDARKPSPNLSEILLYDLTDSPFCLKARICLQLKGVPFRRVTLTLGRRRELQRLNPLGKVPVLVHDGAAIADSSRIARHLEERYPTPALIPVGP